MDPTLIPIAVVIAVLTACGFIVAFFVGLKKHSKRSSQNSSQHHGLPTLESAAKPFQVSSGLSRTQQVHSYQPSPHTLPLSGGVSTHQSSQLLPPLLQQPRFLVQRQPSHSEWSSQHFSHPSYQQQYHQPPPNLHETSNTLYPLPSTSVLHQEHQVTWHRPSPVLSPPLEPILSTSPHYAAHVHVNAEGETSLTQSSEDVDDDSYPELEEGVDLHSFVRKSIISEFNSERSQFAVLIFSEERKLQTIGRMTLFPFYSRLHCSDKLFPGNPDEFYNYLVARPYKPMFSRVIHAEETLMQNVDELLEAYYYHKESEPNYVILYTWLSPCPNCTRLIIETFKTIPDHIPKCVAYTGNWSKYPLNVNERCRKSLRDEGIKVEHISWPREYIV